MTGQGSRRIKSENENSASKRGTHLGATGENNMADIQTNTGQADQNIVLGELLNAAVDKLNLSLKEWNMFQIFSCHLISICF